MVKKIALIIGASKGIGKGISEDLAKEGFITIAASRTKITNVPHENIIPIQLDITSEHSINNAFNEIEREFGKIDVLVNNAGLYYMQNFEAACESDWKTMFETNVFGIFHCIQKSFPLMQKGGARIINMSSIIAKHPAPENSIYIASKRALTGLGETLAKEWYPHNIFTTNIHLGATNTSLIDGLEGFAAEDMLDVKDVARVVAFIANTPLGVRLEEITLTPKKGVL